MKIANIRQLIKGGNFAFYRHAITEAEKDGVSPQDAVDAILSGRVVEKYPERSRCLIYGSMKDNLPLHVVCDYGDGHFIWIVTVYIPQTTDWIAGKKRR